MRGAIDTTGARQTSRRSWRLMLALLLGLGLLGGWLPTSSAARAAAQVAQASPLTFAYTGAVQTWTVPAGVMSATFDVYGAAGGNGNFSTAQGGRATATLAVTPGEVIQLYVGGQGGGVNGCTSQPGPGAGGFNGGGNGGSTNAGIQCKGAGGGGASDVRRGGNTLGARVVVAGGGGGSTPGSACPGGDGGGLNGGGVSCFVGTAAGGGQNAGTGSGMPGQGGDGANGGEFGGGGGGGGYYGGAGGPATTQAGSGGGGGSGYGPSGTVFATGVRAGNGQILITFVVPQTITFDIPAGNPSYTVGQTFTVGATASSGLPVSFAVAGPCSLAGTTVTATGAGTCTVTASQAGDATYGPAPDVTRNFPIGKATQTITFATPAGNPSYIVGQTFTVGATASSGLPVGFAASGACTVSGTTVTATAAGTCTVTASQAGDATYQAAPDVARTFAIAAAPQAAVAPAGLAFGARQVGTASDSQQVTLTNGGGSPLTIAGVTLTGAHPGDFAVTFNTCVGSVPAGGSCVVGVRFAPTAVAARAATLAIADNAAGSPQTVALSGTGTTPPASPAPQSVVTASASGQGGVTPAGATSYATGSRATYTAVPASGQTFTGWTLDGTYVGYANPLTLTVNGNRTLVATFVATPQFSDLGTLPAADQQMITFLAALGIVNPQGVNGSGQFRPNTDVGRAEMAAFVARTFGWEAEFHANTFPDRCVPGDPTNCIDARLWNDVAALRDYGVVGGYTDTATCTAAGSTAPCYLPRDGVKRVQVVSIVARAFIKTPDLRATGFWDRLPADGAQYTNVPTDGTQRSDLTTYRANAGEIPGQASSATFVNPEGNSTRLFVVQVLYQAFNAQFGVDRLP